MEFQTKYTDNAHMHIALSTRLNVVRIREIWTRIGGGVQMRVDPIRNLVSASNYMTKYVFKSVTDVTVNKMYHYEKRYGISQSCSRPEKLTKQYYPKLSNIDKHEKLKEQNMDWVYTMLAKDQFTDGETINI